jgi:hypothetical protein
MADKWLSGFDPDFLNAAATCTRTGNNTDNSTRQKYFETKLRYSHFDWFTKLGSRLGSTIKAPKVAADGQVNTLGLAGIQFIYMDVGCWAGNGKPGWTKHREFGVVFGHLVFLCSFGYELGYHHPERQDDGTLLAQVVSNHAATDSSGEPAADGSSDSSTGVA